METVISVFSALAILLVGLALAALAVWLLRPRKSRELMLCTRCGTQARAHQKMRGSMGVELVLWLCFILPGLIYSAWRHGGTFWGCPKCGGADVIPLDSPAARTTLQKQTAALR